MKLAGWKTQSSKNIFQNKWVSLREDIVIDELDREHTFAVLDLPYGSSVLPIDPEGNVYLVKQFRYGYGDYTIEIPGGQIDKRETVEAAAKRELYEELGITVGELIDLGIITGLTSNINHREHLYLAKLSIVPEVSLVSEEEIIELIKIPFSQAVDWALDGTIVHAPAVSHILRAKEYLRK